MNIAILGGSFDPPHRGHTAIANRLIRLNYFDQVWLMPCYQHPFIKNLSSPDKRFEMTKYLKNDRVMVSDLEIRRKKISYTIDTLRLLAKRHPQDKFSWIIGTDQAIDFTKWKKWQEIINDFNLVIVPRTHFKKAEKVLQDIGKLVKSPKNINLINRKRFPPIYVSSRFIRKKIKERKPISDLVPRAVEEYIIQNKLYR